MAIINNIDAFSIKNVLKTCSVCGTHPLAEGQRYCSLGWTRQGDDNVAVCHNMSHHVMKQEVDEPYLMWGSSRKISGKSGETCTIKSRDPNFLFRLLF